MRKWALLLFVIVFLFVACEGPEGPAGPEGPEGPTGPTVPTINTIAAYPPVIAVGESTELTLTYAYGGTDSVDAAWTAENGTLTQDDLTAVWTAPETAGSYMVHVTLTAGDKTSQGAVSILVTDTGEEATSWTGFVYDEDDVPINAATVWESRENFAMTMPGGTYEIFSTEEKGNLTAHKNSCEALTIKGFNDSPDFYLRETDVEDVPVHKVVVNLSAFWEPVVEENVILRVASIDGGSSGRISFTPSGDRFEYSCSLWVPEGETRIYAVANNKTEGFFGEEFLNVIGDTEIDMEMYTAKTMQVRTILNMPTSGIEKFVVEAWVDSTIVAGSGGIIDHGRMSFQWNTYYDRSERDSIMITDINIDDTPVDVMDYHLTLHVWDRFGNYAKKDLRNAIWGTYWVSFDMSGEFPHVEAFNVSDDFEVSFEIEGLGDIFIFNVIRETTDGYERIWRAITTEKMITLPLLPTGNSLLEPATEYRYQITSFVDPDYSIDDPYIISKVESEKTDFRIFTTGSANSFQSFSF